MYKASLHCSAHIALSIAGHCIVIAMCIAGLWLKVLFCFKRHLFMNIPRTSPKALHRCFKAAQLGIGRHSARSVGLGQLKAI